MTTDVLGYLESKGLGPLLKPAPNQNVHLPCFFHGEEEDDKGRLYIQVDPEAEVPGLFFCHVCEEKGTINKIRAHFGDAIDSDVQFAGKKLQILNEAAAFYHDQLLGGCDDKEVMGEALGFLETRGLFDVIEQAKLGLAHGGNLTDHLMSKGFHKDDIERTGLMWGNTGRDFFDAHTLVIPYYENGECIQIRGRDLRPSKNKYKTPPGQDRHLYNLDTLIDATDVILTEGEFDALMLEELGFNAVGLPGVRAFDEDWVQKFANNRRIYICFDADEPGRDGAEKLSSVFGAKARIIELPAAEPGRPKMDVSEYIAQGHDRADFELLIRNSSTGHLVRVEDAFHAWLDREGNPNQKGLKLGFKKLDETIKPGLLPGQVMVFLARTGTGKTITMINFMHRMITIDPNITMLFVSLEQTRNEWFERARRIYGFYDQHVEDGDLNQGVIDFYQDNLMIVDKNRLSTDELRTCILQSQDELGRPIDMVCVDYLGYWARAFKGEPYSRTSDAVMSLKEVAKSTNTVILSPHQVNRGSKPGTNIATNDARESGVVEETADFLLSINSTDNDPNVQQYTGRIDLEILKSRHGGVGTHIDLQFAPTSLALVPYLDDLMEDKCLRRASDEVSWASAGERDYGKVRERHRTGNRALVVSNATP